MHQSFDIMVKELPARTLVGLFVNTTYQNAFTDCTRVWEHDFMPRLPEITHRPSAEFPSVTYGVSVMTGEEGAFTYWATTELPVGTAVPEGMSVLELPGGLYACCALPSLALLSDAYTYLYTAWSDSNKDYAVNFQTPCFERYDEEYLKSGSLEIYAPVVKR